MRAAMATAEVDDDIVAFDPTAFQFEREMVRIMGKVSALFVPSGTMGNLISVLFHCEIRGSEAIVGDKSHIYVYENGGISTLGGVHSRIVKDNVDGTMDIALVEAAIREPADYLYDPTTRLICLENTHASCGGRCISLEYTNRVGEVAKKHGLKLHIDGARIFNASVDSEKLLLLRRQSIYAAEDLPRQVQGNPGILCIVMVPVSVEILGSASLFKQQQNAEVQILMLLLPLQQRQGSVERWRRARLWILAATLFRLSNGVQPNLCSGVPLLRQRVEQSGFPPLCNLSNNMNQKSDFCFVWPTSIKSESSYFSNGEPMRRLLRTNWTIFERGNGRFENFMPNQLKGKISHGNF